MDGEASVHSVAGAGTGGMATSHCGQMTSLEQRATSAALRGRVRSAGWVRVSRGLYRRPLAEPELADDLRGWQLALPASGAFSHLTGAVLRGWWVPPLPLDLPVFAGISHADPRPRRTGLLVCRHTPRRPLRGARRAAGRHGSGDLLAAARDLGLLDLVVLTDAALRLGECRERFGYTSQVLLRNGLSVLRPGG